MTNFKIKYLDNQPVYDYFDSLELPEAILIDYFYKVVKTERSFGHVYDSNTDNRVIQYIKFEVYEIQTIVGKNIDLQSLEVANHVLVTPDVGSPFIAVNFTVTSEQIENSRDSNVKITFHKEIETNYPLSSDFAESLHPDLPVNEIINKNLYNCIFETESIYTTGLGTAYTFLLNKTDIGYGIDNTEVYNLINDNFAVNTYFYFEVTGVDMEIKDIYECYIATKATDVISLITNVTTETISDLLGVYTIEFRFRPFWYTSSNVVKLPVYSIYTFINPFYDKIITPIEGIEATDGLQENQKVYSYDVARFKLWLKTSELWKIEYLNYALPSEILLTLSDDTEIIPVQTKDIYKRKENENLIDLHEFDIEILYNNKVVNYYR